MRILASLAVLPGLFLLASCGSPPEPGSAASLPEAPAPPAATAPPEPLPTPTLTVPIEARSGSSLTGTATLTATEGGVRVLVSISGVSPGKHGSHVHEKGDCTAPDGASAGSHFNPGGHAHALPQGSPRHLGDLGNVEVGADGKGVLELVAEGANLDPGDPASFLGRSIIVHEKEDDGGQPNGNAGGRIGCAVIAR